MANRAPESQQTTESAPAETSQQSQHDPPPCAPDGFIAVPYPSTGLQTQKLEEAAAEQKPNTPQRPQHHKELQQENVDSQAGVPTQETCNSPVVILVMGVLCCGKTSFIEKAIGHKNENVAANIRGDYEDRGDTFRIDSFSAELDGKQYLFLDSTGSSVLEADSDLNQIISLCDQLSNIQDLNGILYIHPINRERMNGCAMQYLRLFEAVCGRSFMQNVLLLTNNWDRVKPEVGDSREGELCDAFWRRMINSGAKVERLNPNLPECVPTILEWFASRPPATLAIRDEMVHQGKAFAQTSVWSVVLDRMRNTVAPMIPELRYIKDLVTPHELRAEVYKLAFECLRLKQELQDYKEKLEEAQ